MQAPNAQGIGGLMSRPQQTPQQPMPNPQSGSPMAGLGSVQERVNAYRGNAAPLQQRYTVSQDLLDLLALQKIKSEKEAAARQMQLQMGQQQAAQGMEPMTVAQQREKEVMDMTKQELAQQRGATAQQETAEQQQAMQKLLQGIASAPGAATAAQPQMMAAGGIVGYADGGDVEDTKKPLDAKAQAELQEAQRTGDRNAMLMTVKKLAAAGYDVATLLPRAGMGVIEDIANTRLGRALGVDFRFPQAAYGGDRESMTPMMDRVRREGASSVEPTTSATPATPTAPTALGAGAGRGMVNPPMIDPNAPLPPPEGATPRPAPTGLAGLPGAQGSLAAPRPAMPQQPGAPAAPGFEGDIKNAILGAVKADPMAGGAEYGKSVQERLMFPEEQERRRAAVAEQRKLYEQEFDPERQRQEKLSRFLLGMSGRRYGEFAGGAGAAMDYATSQRAAQRERLKGLEDMEQGLFSLRQGATEKGIGAESKLMGELRDQQRAALTGGVQQLGTEAHARTADKQIASQERIEAARNAVRRAEIAAQQARTKVDQGILDQTRLTTQINALSRTIADFKEKVTEKYAPQLGALEMDLRGSNPERKAKAQAEMQNINTLINAETEKEVAGLRKQIAHLESLQYGTPTGGPTGGMPPGFRKVGEQQAR